MNEITKRFWKEIRRCAEKRQIKFELKPEEAWHIFIKQDKRCVFTGSLIDFSTYGYRGTASLDRIDSQDHYHKGNIQWVFAPINIMKGPQTDVYFKSLCLKVALKSLLENSPQNNHPNIKSIFDLFPNLDAGII